MLSNQFRSILYAALVYLPAVAGAVDDSVLHKANVNKINAANLPQLIEEKTAAWESLPEPEKVFLINKLFNNVILYRNDFEIWGISDYWASPDETISKGMGDCEDIAILKFFYLIKMGVPERKLRLAYVLLKNKQSRFIPHIVVQYLDKPNAEPLILDNLSPNISPLSNRVELKPILSFNKNLIWIDFNNSKKSTPSSSYLRWQQLLKKINSTFQ